jgi:hypothetical protein
MAWFSFQTMKMLGWKNFFNGWNANTWNDMVHISSWTGVVLRVFFFWDTDPKTKEKKLEITCYWTLYNNYYIIDQRSVKSFLNIKKLFKCYQYFNFSMKKNKLHNFKSNLNVKILFNSGKIIKIITYWIDLD